MHPMSHLLHDLLDCQDIHQLTRLLTQDPAIRHSDIELDERINRVLAATRPAPNKHAPGGHAPADLTEEEALEAIKEVARARLERLAKERA